MPETYEPELLEEIQRTIERHNQRKAEASRRAGNGEMTKEERERYAKIEQVNQRIFIDDRLSRALDAIGVEPALKRGAFAIHRSKVRVIDDPESDYGMRTVVEIGDGQMGLEEYLKNWAQSDEEAAAYLHPGKTADGRQKYRSQLSPLEKSQFIREHGKPAYDRLPWSPDEEGGD